MRSDSMRGRDSGSFPRTAAGRRFRKTAEDLGYLKLQQSALPHFSLEV